MNPREWSVSWIAAGLVLATTVSPRAQQPAARDNAYRVPPQAIQDIVDAPQTPAVRVGPRHEWLLLLERPNLPAIAELSQPELRLAGLRINPRTNGPSRAAHFTGLRLVNVASKVARTVTGLPAYPRIGNVVWSPDGERAAFSHTAGNRIELWILDIGSATASRLTGRSLNGVFGNPIRWFANSRALVCRTVADSRGRMPVRPDVPTGPVIQESTGRRAAARTYQDLLNNPHDDALFTHFAFTQVYKFNLRGKGTPLGEPGLIRRAEPSPGGRYILVERLHTPFSYLVPHFRFPLTVDLWHADGTPLRRLADLPLAEEIPIGRGAVRTGPRNYGWRPDVADILYWVEALDGGDPRLKTDERDRVMLLLPPFDGPPQPLITLGLRFAGIAWGDERLALVTENWWRDRHTRTWRTVPGGTGRNGRNGTAPVILFDRSSEDRYTDPGRPVTERNEYGRDVLLQSHREGALFFAGVGASPEGDRPFVDKLDLTNGKTERLWRSEAPYYESFIAFLADDQSKILSRRESPSQPPNYYVRTIEPAAVDPITDFPHPYPQLADTYKEVLRYERDDGAQLTATLYLPPGHQPSDGPLPLLMWAYPREFKSAASASQMRGSPYRFNAISPRGPLPFLATGYAVLDGPTMPIVGEGDAEPNDSYIEQLVASAKAAIDEVVRIGVADRSRIAIGGHSYGAFMTANLLAHSDLFAAGIARSGAYNRTLTPFGFQAEDRTFWEAPEVYFGMSPFMHADVIDEPILLIHGEADNNSGTFPIQSKRFYSALKGHGTKTRLVMLPHESHGYAARESVLHTLWEMNDWLDHYLRTREIESR